MRQHQQQIQPERYSYVSVLLSKLLVNARELISKQYAVLNEELIPALRKEGIYFLSREEWAEEQQLWLHDYFTNEILPIITPIGLDTSHPFPNLLNKSLNFLVELEGKDVFKRNSSIAIVQAPRILPRMILLPDALSVHGNTLIFLSSIIHEFVHELFLGMNVKGCYPFRLTRDTGLYIDDDVDSKSEKNLLHAIEDELHNRQYGQSVRLEVADNCPEDKQQFLLKQFGLTSQELYVVNGPVNLVRLFSVPDLVEKNELLYPSFKPGKIKKLKKDPFKTISQNDVLLYHPYQSFQPVIDFVKKSAVDPNVVAIKMTVYRTGDNSELMRALIAAAYANKQVTVIVELLARFDEAANIAWAQKLEEAGAHVVYGVYGYKVHAKMLMVIRRENGKLKPYVHLGTGNYNQKTAKLYTDFGLLTTNQEIAEDVNNLFLQVTGLGDAGQLKKLYQSPFTLHDMLLNHIQFETEQAKQGKPAKIIAKMNGLLEPKIINALYKASQAGVKIQLIIRGACTLKPEVKGLSENITVISIVGRFLEHTRVFYFYHQKEQRVYISSADWMNRNLFHRIETCIPILDDNLKKRVIQEGLKVFLTDNVNAWVMQPDGTYKEKRSTNIKRCAQEILMKQHRAN